MAVAERGEGALDDRVLGIEARQTADAGNAQAGDGDGADGHHRIGDRQQLPQTAHLPHVLLVVHAVDHRAGTEEQQGLEEGVGEQVEHGGLVGTDARREEHVAELRTGRIGDDPLDVVLGQADRRREQGRDRAGQGNDGRGDRGVFIDRRQQADHVDAGGDHGRRVDQGRHRGRALHGVRQPGVQEELGRFAHGADEQQGTREVERRPGVAEEDPARARLRGDHREQFGELDRAEHPEHRQDAEGEAEVTDPVDHKGLDGGGTGGGLLVPEADQQIGRQPHPFPAEEQLHEVGGGDQRQHGEGEQRQIGEEPRLVGILGHIPPGIEVDERGHAGDHDQHDGRQRVDTDRPDRLEIADVDEREQLDREGLQPAPGPLAEHDPGHGAGEEQQAGGDRFGDQVAEPPAAQADDGRAEQRGEDAEGDEKHEIHGQPFITEASSTAMSPRLRKKVTRMARPTAASAAATVRTNMAMICPCTSFR